MNSAPHDADLITIGSGHNTLVAAAYAAKAGYKVIVLEKRADIGGAVCTREMFGGYRMDIGGSLHCMIHRTPILKDLQLHQYGLEYIEVDPILSVPLPDERHFCIFRSLEKTCESMAEISAEDAERYYDFMQKWHPLNSAIFDFFLQSPTFHNFWRTVLKPSHGMRARERVGLLSSLRQSYGDIIRHTFKNNHIQGALAWWAAQSAPPPHEKSSAEFFGWQSMLHEIGAYRPRGGSGMLTQALARCIRDHGGIIMPSTEVAKIIVRESRVQGVETARGNSIYAPAIVASAHIKIVFEELLREWTPPRMQKRIAGLNIGNGFGMVLRCATDKLPRYHHDSAINNRLTTAIQLLCPSLHYLEESYNDFAHGIPSKNPAALAMTFSSVDCTLAPKGKHLLFIWGQYYPYRLRSPLCWKDIAQQEADKLINVVERAAPGTKDSIRDCYIQSPPEISQLHSMPCANIMHIEMTMKSMLTRRPHRTLRDYHTPLRGLFVANAGMHPGGGISGAAGYNCHVDLLRFLEGRRGYHTERFIAAQND